MTKKNQDFVKELQTAQQQGNLKPIQIKKSRSTEDLTTKPKPSEQITHLEQQLTQTQEQFNLQKSLGNHEPSLLRKAREELITIRKRLQELFPKQTSAKPSELLEQLITQRHELTDQNNELRINNLKQKDYFPKYQQEQKLTQQLKLQVAKLQKDLTITQQDLKSAQRIIELRTLKLDNKDREESPFDYWSLIRFGLLALIVYLSFNNQQKQENNHGKFRN